MQTAIPASVKEKSGKRSAVRRFGLAAAVLPLLFAIQAGPAQAQAKNGTTLAAYKTIDICEVNPTTWRYSGLIAVWNSGAVDTQGLQIIDTIQSKVGTNWISQYNVPVGVYAEIPAGTTLETATVFPYSVDLGALSGTIRNVANVTITNHSGSLGTKKGPETKATFTGTVEPCKAGSGCAYTQGYWKSKPNVVWPQPYTRSADFYLSAQSWQKVLENSGNTAPGYYQLAHQFIAATLNVANGASVPSGIKDTLVLAENWLGTNTPAACAAKGSCGEQKDWGAVLDQYNNGKYAGGPPHCE